jgi:hypothetical protein
LRIGDSRFFPTLAGLVILREVRGDGSKPVLQRRGKRYQVVLELRLTLSISRDQPENRDTRLRICQKPPGILNGPE